MPTVKFDHDQATSLRRIARARPIQVMAVTSGKGGVGKTNISVNLALAMTYADKEVMLMDADLGLANVDVLLGLHPMYNLSHVISGEQPLEDAVVKGPGNLKIIPAASGIQEMARLSRDKHAALIRAFSDLGHGLDVLIVDTAAGIADSVIDFTTAAHEIIVVVCDEPASITDAYALIKVLSRDYGRHRFRVLVNLTDNSRQGKALYLKLLKVTDKFLDVCLDFMGAIPRDSFLLKAVQHQRAVVDVYPASQSAMAFKSLAKKADKWPRPDHASGRLEFFVERLIQTSMNEVRMQA